MTRLLATANPTLPVTSLRMGELAVGNSDSVFKTLLGSCIGLALYDSRSQIGGLAHIVLPSSKGHADELLGKFADTAIPELIRGIEQLGGKLRSLRAKLAGGANMFHSSSEMAIGELNLKAIHQELLERSIPVAASHCGGTQGRRMTFRPATGAVVIEIVGKPPVEI